MDQSFTCTLMRYLNIWFAESNANSFDRCTWNNSMVGWLVVFNVPSTARSLRDGTPIYYPLRRTWSLINTPFRPGIEPQAVAWQSFSLPLRYASSTRLCHCSQLASEDAPYVDPPVYTPPSGDASLYTHPLPSLFFLSAICWPHWEQALTGLHISWFSINNGK